VVRRGREGLGGDGGWEGVGKSDGEGRGWDGKGTVGRGRRGKRRGKGRGEGGKGREGKGEGRRSVPTNKNLRLHPLVVRLTVLGDVVIV